MGDERIGEAVGNLEGYAEQHREDEENGHILLPEQCEGPQTENVHEGRGLPGCLVDRAGRQCQGVEAERESEDSGGEELVVGHLELHSVNLHEVHEEHAADEADSTEDPDWREVLHRVKPVFLET